MNTRIQPPPPSPAQLFNGLRCRECGKEFPADVRYVCDHDFGPVEVAYDYEAIGERVSRGTITSREPNMWRYRELLPVEGEDVVGRNVGFTPLVQAERLAERLGVRELWVKNDTVNYPTLSFKDRVVSVAMTRAREFGFKVVGCASTGNLANAVAAQAAAAGLESYVIIPADLEMGKVVGSLVFGTRVVSVEGTYDQVNRLCSEIAGRHHWAFVNVNLRPYYAEGSKSMGFEIAEQLGWRLPDAVVTPMAGGSLICKIDKAFEEFTRLGLVEDHPTRIYGAQAAGCSPIVNMVKEERDWIRPIKIPDTIARSLAIGDPADGPYAVDTMRRSGGYGENPSDAEIIAGIRMLAECEGIFAETAGGVSVAAAKRLIDAGRINRDDTLVLCVTGHGLKTKEAVESALTRTDPIAPTIKDFEALLDQYQNQNPEEASCP